MQVLADQKFLKFTISVVLGNAECRMLDISPVVYVTR